MKSIICPWFEVTGCCEQLVQQLNGVVASWDKMGMVQRVSSPERANLLILGGWINSHQSQRIRQIYQVMAGPKKVIAFGVCAVSGGVMQSLRSECFTASEVIPVDQFVVGCPPRWDDIFSAISEEFYQKSLGEGIKELLNENSSEPVF